LTAASAAVLAIFLGGLGSFTEMFTEEGIEAPKMSRRSRSHAT
jgi:hypothetical protein